MLLSIWEGSYITSRDFVYWLQGLFELADPKQLNHKQTELVKKHLHLVFAHEIDPSMGDSEHQGKLDAIHNGNSTNLLSDGILQGTLESTANNFNNVGHLTQMWNMSKEELDEMYGVGVRPRC